MKVLLINKYFYPKGGAEVSFFETGRLLERRQHDVMYFSMRHPKNLPSSYSRYFTSQVDYDQGGVLAQARAAGRLLYSFEARRRLEALLRDERPDVAHLNNIYHQLSPSILHTLKQHRVPIVMTLRDYKLVCGSYLLVANGRPCEACRGGRYYHSVVKSCVKRSRTKSLLSAAEMYLHHAILRIYDLVDVFIAPSRFLQQKMADMGFQRRIEHLPNCVDVERYLPRYDAPERSIVYFGRLSEEKGLFTLLRAMRGLPDLQLKLIGDGPLRSALEEEIRQADLANVHLMGSLVGDSLHEAVSRAMFTVLPSEVYENNPRMILEGFALGKPAVASRIGGIPELVREDETGLLFPAGDADALRRAIDRLAHDATARVRMGHHARILVERDLNEARHYERLMDIYHHAQTRGEIQCETLA